MKADLFRSVAFLPDPTPGEENQYTHFADVCWTQTTEKFRPSSQLKQKKLPFSRRKQHVKNIDMMLQCTECKQWRLLFTKRKLKPAEKAQLTNILDDIEYTCGAPFGRMNLLYFMVLHCNFCEYYRISQFTPHFFPFPSTGTAFYHLKVCNYRYCKKYISHQQSIFNTKYPE